MKNEGILNNLVSEKQNEAAKKRCRYSTIQTSILDLNHWQQRKARKKVYSILWGGHYNAQKWHIFEVDVNYVSFAIIFLDVEFWIQFCFVSVSVSPSTTCDELAAGPGWHPGILSVLSSGSEHSVEPCSLPGPHALLQFLHCLQAAQRLFYHEQDLQRPWSCRQHCRAHEKARQDGAAFVK